MNSKKNKKFSETEEIMATPGAYKKIMEGIRDIKKGRVILLEDFKAKEIKSPFTFPLKSSIK